MDYAEVHLADGVAVVVEECDDARGAMAADDEFLF